MGFFNKLKTSLGLKTVDATTLESLEDALLRADVGLECTDALLAELKRKAPDDGATFLKETIAKRLKPAEKAFTLPPQERPHLVLFVGVNGSGKTTTLGKIAAQLKAQGQSVLVAAGDTFRAAAVAQLKIWTDRAKVPVFAPEKEGADAAALILSAMQQAEADGTQVVLADTAGRLQNRDDLMAELGKITRVLAKHGYKASETLLIIDATVGQNALRQAAEFQKLVPLSGLVVTKLDSSAKAGVLLPLAVQHPQLPIYFVGLGEQLNDLQPFVAKDFAEALVG